MTKSTLTAIRRAKISLLTAMRTSPIYADYISYLESELDNERQVFENSAANEFTRGRIDMLKSLLHELRG